MTIHRLEDLINAKELLSDPKKWTKGALARDTEGEEISPKSAEATCFCALGALSKVSDKSHKSRSVLYYAAISLGFLKKGEGGIPNFNDHPNTTHEDIMKVFDKAIELAKEEQC